MCKTQKLVDEVNVGATASTAGAAFMPVVAHEKRNCAEILYKDAFLYSNVGLLQLQHVNFG